MPEVNNLQEKVELTFEVTGIENAEDEIRGGFSFLLPNENIAGDFLIG
tara:strand:+ start:249 stop:392 length:144 start_codon:yes stop_codon:yes gene_type:complete